MNITFTPKIHNSLIPALLSAVLVIFILIFLKPFGIYYDNFDLYYFSLLAGYGILSFFPIALLEKYYPQIHPKNKIISYSAGSLIVLTVISIIVWKYSHFLHAIAPQFNFPAFSFPDAVFKAIAVGIIPLSIRGLFLYWKNHQSNEAANIEETIQLTSADGKDWFIIDWENILYIKSCDNYVEIHYVAEEKKCNKRLIRNTLSNLEKQLSYTSLFRCHRSYLVNLDKVSQIEGNRKNTVLYLLGLLVEIPVSRTRIPQFQVQMNARKQQIQ